MDQHGVHGSLMDNAQAQWKEERERLDEILVEMQTKLADVQAQVETSQAPSDPDLFVASEQSLSSIQAGPGLMSMRRGNVQHLDVNWNAYRYIGDFAGRRSGAAFEHITITKGHVIVGGVTLTSQPATNEILVSGEDPLAHVYLRIYFDSGTLKTELISNDGDITQVSGSIHILLGIATVPSSGDPVSLWKQKWTGGSIQLPSRPA